MLERALPIRGTKPRDLAETRFALARALWQLGQQRPAALRYAEQALEDYRRAGQPQLAAEVETWLARRR
jgi:hypothetical protein